jgi:hypothetical protein
VIFVGLAFGLFSCWCADRVMNRTVSAREMPRLLLVMTASCAIGCMIVLWAVLP